MKAAPILILLKGAALGALVLLDSSATALEPVSEVRLYAINCGHVKVKDAALFSDTGEYEGKPLEAIAPCFLVRHPKGMLMWDAGLSDELGEAVAMAQRSIDEGRAAKVLGELVAVSRAATSGRDDA